MVPLLPVEMKILKRPNLPQHQTPGASAFVMGVGVPGVAIQAGNAGPAEKLGSGRGVGSRGRSWGYLITAMARSGACPQPCQTALAPPAAMEQVSPPGIAAHHLVASRLGNKRGLRIWRPSHGPRLPGA